MVIKKIHIIVLGVILPIVLSFAVYSLPAGAFWGGDACSGTNTDLCSNRGNTNMGSLVAPVVSFLLFISGIVSVIMIIVGGIKFATSSGDPSKAASARKTIIYAVIGLVISVSAMAIVRFVNDRLLSENKDNRLSNTLAINEEVGQLQQMKLTKKGYK